jgi:hypothetical protein
MKTSVLVCTAVVAACSADRENSAPVAPVPCEEGMIVVGDSNWESQGTYQFEMCETCSARLTYPTAAETGSVNFRFSYGSVSVLSTYQMDGAANVQYHGEGLGDLAGDYNVVEAENCEGEFPSEVTVDQRDGWTFVHIQMYDLHRANRCPGGRIDGALAICIQVRTDRLETADEMQSK